MILKVRQSLAVLKLDQSYQLFQNSSGADHMCSKMRTYV